jgi:hypothetical protein
MEKGKFSMSARMSKQSHDDDDDDDDDDENCCERDSNIKSSDKATRIVNYVFW